MRSYPILLLAIAFADVICEDFGMRLTTESMKTKNNTHYSFHYFVKDDATGDYKTQEETKEGDSVRGSYTLAEPNGDLRTVMYQAGPGKGFEVKVDVQPSGSPMKQITEKNADLKTPTISDAKTAYSAKTGKTVNVTPTLESNVKHFPGGFAMDVLSKPQADVKTEMGMRFSLTTNSSIESVTDTNSGAPAVENNSTEQPETTLETVLTTYGGLPTDNFQNSTVESSTLLTEGKEKIEDPIEKEIDEAINSMPKLPELILSDNKTHFKFHKDPEEALLDERITQIARQLAETSLRREYEERKLGHFIPISVSPIEPSSSSHLSKSLKFLNSDLPKFRSSESSPLNLLPQLPVVPQFVYRQTSIPNISSINYRLPVVNIPLQQTQQWADQTPETITNPPDLLKINKLESPTKETISKKNEVKYGTKYETSDSQPISIMPVQVPTFFQFFTPYVMHTPGNHITPKQPDLEFHSKGVKNDLTKEEIPKINYDTKLHAQLTMADREKAKNIKAQDLSQNQKH